MASGSGVLSSFLLKGSTSADDGLFATSKGASLSFSQQQQPSSPSSSKAKSNKSHASTRKGKQATVEALNAVQDAGTSSSEEEVEEPLPAGLDDEQQRAILKARAFSRQLKASLAGKPVKKRKAQEIEPDAPALDDDDDDDGDEAVEEEEEEEEEAEDSDDDLKSAEASTKKNKKPRTPEEERERNARTLFIGNVPAACATSRPLKKALIRHLTASDAVLASLPDDVRVKCESIRFRSLAFSSTIFGRSEKDVVPADLSHAKKRARMWKDAATPDEVEQADRTVKKGLSDKQKRKAAAIKQELNENKKNCNAYLVLAVTPADATAETVDAVVRATHNTPFEGFTLRVDWAASTGTATTSKSSDRGLTSEEARRTIFLGGLDFAETEENVRTAVQAALARHLSDEKTTFVDDVRIVRDPATGLGKGFAYVRFTDERNVDHILAIPSDRPLKISKRKVRLERCKTRSAALRSKAKAAAMDPSKSGPGSTNGSNGTHQKPGQKSSHGKPGRAAIVDPALLASLAEKAKSGPSERDLKRAEQLGSLDKDERKRAKALDAERVARRIAKKQAKVLAQVAERKQQREGGGGGDDKLGRESRAEKRNRQEKKRVRGVNAVKKPVGKKK